MYTPADLRKRTPDLTESPARQVFPWTQIQEAHKDMEADKNMCVAPSKLITASTDKDPPNSGKIVVEVV